MVRKNKIKHSHGRQIWYLILFLVILLIFITFLVHDKNIALLNSQGLIAQEQKSLLLYILAVLSAVAIPVVALLYFTAWKYRESNTKAAHHPEANQSKFLVASMWMFPIIIMLVLTTVLYPATHKLEPHKKISNDAKPLKIKVVSMRWKWVFMYPDQNIASVNFVQIPVNTPVTFELIADEAPMSSFWIPNLGGQLYSMTSHVNVLNLIAETPGDYPGSSAELNGAGFSHMKFTTRASSAHDFERWVDNIRQTNSTLDIKAYDNLLKPSENHPAVFYSGYQENLYSRAIEKYSGAHKGHIKNTVHEGH